MVPMANLCSCQPVAHLPTLQAQVTILIPCNLRPRLIPRRDLMVIVGGQEMKSTSRLDSRHLILILMVPILDSAILLLPVQTAQERIHHTPLQ